MQITDIDILQRRPVGRAVLLVKLLARDELEEKAQTEFEQNKSRTHAGELRQGGWLATRSRFGAQKRNWI